MSQQALGCHDDQWLSEGHRDLSAEDVEIVGWCRAVGDDPVDVVELSDGEFVAFWWEVVGIVRGHLQEALETGGGVFRSHSLHAMRQQHDQATLTHPLGLSGAHELIDDALGCVVEVTELSFPEDEGVGVGHRVAELKSEHAVFRQRAVADSVGSLVGVQVAQRTVGGLVDFLVVQDVVTMREGSTLDVLSRQSHVNSLLHQRSEGEGFSQGPIGDSVVDHVLAGGQHAHQTLVDGEFRCVWWWRRETVADVDEGFLDASSGGDFQRVLALEEA
jgi:hypothetical protein